MITAVIQHKNDTLVVVLPRANTDLQIKLLSIGVRTLPQNIKLFGGEDAEVDVQLASGSRVGQHLCRLFNTENSLGDVNTTAYLVQTADESIKTDLEHDIYYDQYSTAAELINDIKDRTLALGPVKMSLYFPLTGNIDEGDGNPFTVGDSFLYDYRYDINDLIEEYQDRDVEDILEYFDGDASAKAKLVSAQWSTEIVDGTLYGKEMLEYEDYLKEPTVGNASEFITRALEDNAYEVMQSKTYADYIATRPRAERFGSHGLFTDDGVQVKLGEVSDELNHHDGNVWTVIISLRREDAERLGYNNGERWRDMLRTKTNALAKSFKIPMESLHWYAAFHNESHHPHVHLMVYSDRSQKPYLSRQGIMSLRSSLARDIFGDDLREIYQRQTEHRDDLRLHSSQLIAEIVEKINSGVYDNPKVEEMLKELADRLYHTSGKKQYGYLKSDVKAIVNRIVMELAADERIAALYDLWYEQREKVLGIYTQDLPERIPLVDNEEFKSVKNAVILWQL